MVAMGSSLLRSAAYTWPQAGQGMGLDMATTMTTMINPRGAWVS
jgi:hypothetical protein